VNHEGPVKGEKNCITDVQMPTSLGMRKEWRGKTPENRNAFH
jgi:hypothetical protein